MLIQICVLFVAGCVTTHKCKELKETSLEFLSEDKFNDKGTNFDLIQGFNHPDSIEVNHRWDTSIDTLIGEWHIKLNNMASEKVFITNESDRCVFLNIDHSQEKITDCKEINSSIFSIATPFQLMYDTCVTPSYVLINPAGTRNRVCLRRNTWRHSWRHMSKL